MPEQGAGTPPPAPLCVNMSLFLLAQQWACPTGPGQGRIAPGGGSAKKVVSSHRRGLCGQVPGQALGQEWGPRNVAQSRGQAGIKHEAGLGCCAQRSCGRRLYPSGGGCILVSLQEQLLRDSTHPSSSPSPLLLPPGASQNHTGSPLHLRLTEASSHLRHRGRRRRLPFQG